MCPSRDVRRCDRPDRFRDVAPPSSSPLRPAWSSARVADRSRGGLVRKERHVGHEERALPPPRRRLRVPHMSSIVTFNVWDAQDHHSQRVADEDHVHAGVVEDPAKRASYAVIITIFAPSAFIRQGRGCWSCASPSRPPFPSKNAASRNRIRKAACRHASGAGRAETSRTAAAPFYDPVSVRTTWIPAYVVLRPAFHTLDFLTRCSRSRGSPQSRFARVDHQERGLVIVEKVFVISIAQRAQVVKGDVSFVGDPRLRPWTAALGRAWR